MLATRSSVAKYRAQAYRNPERKSTVLAIEHGEA